MHTQSVTRLEPQPRTGLIRCPGCDLVLTGCETDWDHLAVCPRCATKLQQGRRLSFNGELAIALTVLVLFFPAHGLPLLSINLLGKDISASVLTGANLLWTSYPFVTALVVFCASLAPLLFTLAILVMHLARRHGNIRLFRPTVTLIDHLRHWVMADVFMVSLAIACFKIQDYAELRFSLGLACYATLQILLSVLLVRVNTRRYWDAFLAPKPVTSIHNLIRCDHCGLTQYHGTQTHCQRCERPLHVRLLRSEQKTWACLLTAAVFLLPANLYPISIFFSNGIRLEDTIFSGVASLINNGMPGIAAIIFTASIIVPVAKILGLGFILISLHTSVAITPRQRMWLYRSVKWIGKWSMMDLFVIAFMVALVDRGRIMDFTPGPGAIAFGIVVVLTMLATDLLDTRLIWDHHERQTRRADANH
ncbi:paraquat-inducible protein A [Salinivibrio proteolyticus]|uniref:Paraquat-inducible protein A n=1 Tax=Salinivibrio proteolyticus TaxID=334715 RepID=A0ABY7L8G2_9GAMM|nr:paraquat-inducible protein A [Salinivibrio proteolyticus]WBA13550.1 paraquat-inducible protein A [Salinivibrio proteolyticus]